MPGYAVVHTDSAMPIAEISQLFTAMYISLGPMGWLELLTAVTCLTVLCSAALLMLSHFY